MRKLLQWWSLLWDRVLWLLHSEMEFPTKRDIKLNIINRGSFLVLMEQEQIEQTCIAHLCLLCWNSKNEITHKANKFWLLTVHVEIADCLCCKNCLSSYITSTKRNFDLSYKKKSLNIFKENCCITSIANEIVRYQYANLKIYIYSQCFHITGKNLQFWKAWKHIQPIQH